MLCLSAAFTATVAGFAALVAASRLQPAIPQASTCHPLPLHLKSLSKPLTITEVEENSLKEMSKSSGTPRLPFGHMNTEWNSLKDEMTSGDTLHAFETDLMGGHLVLRKGCVVSQITSWIR